ncbi:F-box protein At3g07870-like [Lycium barbarum]|uniref:F-box protein At3g07870-like n=1 Tax=Lycium barbarum TaxID=112863 RepID=UPI00293F564B|nr:F-box protein At3g07870-like [Lycium barbarum]
MSDYLPQELMIDIFTRLPVKSILRCTSLCKTWYSLLTSPVFISMHLNRKQDEHILIQYYSRNPDEEVYGLFCDDENLNQYAQFDLPFKRTSRYFNIVGSCNGLLCLADGHNCYRKHFYLWNPCIRKSVKLPTPIYTFKTHGTCDHTQGFGFDHVTNDYKVVRIVQTTYCLLPPNVELYKLSTGVWKDISHGALSCQIFSSTPHYMNGASHWIAFKCGDEPTRSMIVLFDMHDETFSEMMLPSNLTSKVGQCDDMFLSMLDESLCLVDNNYNESKPVDIWIMRDYGAPESWVKQFSISSLTLKRNVTLHGDISGTAFNGRSVSDELEVTHDLVKPMAIRKNGEIVCKTNRRLLVSGDHVVGKLKYIGIDNSTNGWCHNPLYLNYYKESLVLPDKWTNNCVGDACEESSDLCKRERKDGRRKLLRGKTKNRMRIASLLHMSGLLYVSKMKKKMAAGEEKEEHASQKTSVVQLTMLHLIHCPW